MKMCVNTEMYNGVLKNLIATRITEIFVFFLNLRIKCLDKVSMKLTLLLWKQAQGNWGWLLKIVNRLYGREWTTAYIHGQENPNPGTLYKRHIFLFIYVHSVCVEKFSKRKRVSIFCVVTPSLLSDCWEHMVPPALTVPGFAVTERQTIKRDVRTSNRSGTWKEHRGFNQHSGF